MKKILLLITVLTVLGACEKESLLDEVRNYLEVEKAKINQDSLSAIVEGKWQAVDEKNGTHLIFSSNPKNFKGSALLAPSGTEDNYFNVDDYFFIKLDTFPNLYKLVAQHDRFGENIPDYYAIIKIEKEFIFYAPPLFREKDSKEFIYRCIMAKKIQIINGNPSEIDDYYVYKKIE